MSEGLRFISTKLKMPQPRKNYIIRKEIFENLTDVFDYKLVIVNGPAASGKTTLLSSFIKDKEVKTYKWLSLDEDNNDIYSFWYYFIEALREELGKEAENVVLAYNSVVNPEEMEGVIIILINMLENIGDALIVFDDFHYIKDQKLIESIEFFIKYSSSNVHMAFLTREDIPIYIGDLRVAGQVIEIGESELKLTESETRDFLIDTLKTGLSDEAIEKMSSLTEGWIGGLQLLAVASLGGKNAMIKDINAINKYVIDYLSKEILSSLSEGEKDFVVRTSSLGYFDAHICDELLGLNNSDDVIQVLNERICS